VFALGLLLGPLGAMFLGFFPMESSYGAVFLVTLGIAMHCGWLVLVKGECSTCRRPCRGC